jgi:hypothetical protein
MRKQMCAHILFSLFLFFWWTPLTRQQDARRDKIIGVKIKQNFSLVLFVCQHFLSLALNHTLTIASSFFFFVKIRKMTKLTRQRLFVCLRATWPWRPEHHRDFLDKKTSQLRRVKQMAESEHLIDT